MQKKDQRRTKVETRNITILRVAKNTREWFPTETNDSFAVNRNTELRRIIVVADGTPNL